MHDDEQEIQKLVATWLRASREGDIQTVLGLMAEDVVFLVPGHPPMRGRAAFAASQAGLCDVDIDGRSEIQEITVLGDWAYVWTTLTITVTPKSGGAPVRRSGPTLSIVQKQNGKWVIVRDANMLTVVPG